MSREINKLGRVPVQTSFERRELGNYPPSTFTILPNGFGFFRDLKEKIDGAATSIRIQSFIFNHENVGVIKSLETAARRGVPVQIIMDGMYPRPHNWVTTKRTLGITRHVRQLISEGLPIDFVYPPKETDLPHASYRRDHAKNFVIDGEIPERAFAYIGGRNIWQSDLSNHDFMIRMTGEMANFAREDFDRTLQGMDSRGTRYVDTGGNMLVRDARKTYEIADISLSQLQAILHEPVPQPHRIWFTTPYYDRKLYSEMLIAIKKARPDIDIRFFSTKPINNNHWNYIVSSPFYLQELAENSIQVYEFQGGFSHGKAMLIDDLAIVGSSNFSNLKWQGGGNAELELFTRDGNFVKQLEDVFVDNFVHSVVRTPSQPTIFDLAYRRLRPKDPKFSRRTDKAA